MKKSKKMDKGNTLTVHNMDKRIKNYLEQEKKEINNIDEEIERLDWIIENTEDKKEKTTAKNEKMQIHYEVVIQVDSYLYNPLFLIYTHSFFYLLLYPLSSVFSAFFRSLLLFFLSYLLYSLLSNPIFLSLHLYYLFLSSLVLDNFLFFYLYYIYYSYLYMFPLLPLFLLLSPHTV